MLASPTDITKKKFRVSRGAYRLGVRLMSGRAGGNERIGAVVQFDFAVEALLRAFLFEQHLSVPDRFEQLLGDVDKAMQGIDPTVRLKDRSHLKHVRDIRNAAQHATREPSIAELFECRLYTRDALTSFCRTTWGDAPWV